MFLFMISYTALSLKCQG